MSKGWFVWRIVATVILVGLLAAGGIAIHRLGWAQGYAAGQLEAGEGAAQLPGAFPGFGHPGWHFGFHPFFGAGLILTVGLGLLMLALVGKLVRLWVWGSVGRRWTMPPRPMDPRWARRWHRYHGPVPPWCWGEPPQGEDEPETEDAAA
jgi:hypothetical protein